MAKLVCQCGHPVELHDWEGCQANTNVAPNFVCMCQHDEAQVLRAAQRKAAIEHLRGIGVLYRMAREEYLSSPLKNPYPMYSDYMQNIREKVVLLKALGILGQDKDK